MREILLVIHILLGITWVGGIMFIGWGVFPATLHMTLENQRQFLIRLMKGSHHLFSFIGAMVIITGVLLGTVFGPIKSLDTLLHSTYGHLFLTAFILGIFTLFWGIFVGYHQMMDIFTDEYYWKEAENGNKSPLIRALSKLTLLESVEVMGFIAIVVIMVLL